MWDRETEEKRRGNGVKRSKAKLLNMGLTRLCWVTEICHTELKLNKNSYEFWKQWFLLLITIKSRDICPLWNSMHHLQQCFLCSAVNPHWYHIKLWQISCSGHHNSSLAVLSCPCYRSYPIPVWPTLLLLLLLLLLMHKLLHSTPAPPTTCSWMMSGYTHMHTESKQQLLIKLAMIALYLSSPASCRGQQFIRQYAVS